MKNSVLVNDSIEGKIKDKLKDSIRTYDPEPVQPDQDVQTEENQIKSDALVIRTIESNDCSNNTVSSSNDVLSDGKNKIKKTMIKFSLVQLLKLFILIVFVLNFFCERYLKHDELLYHIFVDSYLFKIVAILLENLSIPLFMYVFGNFVIGGNDPNNKCEPEIKDFRNKNENK